MRIFCFRCFLLILILNSRVLIAAPVKIEKLGKNNKVLLSIEGSLSLKEGDSIGLVDTAGEKIEVKILKIKDNRIAVQFPPEIIPVSGDEFTSSDVQISAPALNAQTNAGQVSETKLPSNEKITPPINSAQFGVNEYYKKVNPREYTLATSTDLLRSSTNGVSALSAALSLQLGFNSKQFEMGPIVSWGMSRVSGTGSSTNTFSYGGGGFGDFNFTANEHPNNLIPFLTAKLLWTKVSSIKTLTMDFGGGVKLFALGNPYTAFRISPFFRRLRTTVSTSTTSTGGTSSSSTTSSNVFGLSVGLQTYF